MRRPPRKRLVDDDYGAELRRQFQKKRRLPLAVVLSSILVLYLKPELWPLLANALEFLNA